MKSENLKSEKDYLGRKLSEGKLILFTGAGFSSGVKDKKGRPLPLSDKLAVELSDLIGINDSECSLKDSFQLAISRQKNKTISHLRERLTVDTASIGDEYKIMLNQHWYKIYTINIDDLFDSLQIKFKFDRRIQSISYNDSIQRPIQIFKNLIVTYLHGRLDDIPDRVTFSQEQYSERMAKFDAYYDILASEILSHPFIFIGSELEEDIFWHYIYLRKRKGSIRDFNELRPKSFIILPKLSTTKQELLKEYNITWIPKTCKEFINDFLIPLEDQTKQGLIAIKKQATESVMNTIPFVSGLITSTKNLKQPRLHYLLGVEPSWKDISSNLSITRDKESQWFNILKDHLNQPIQKPTPIVLFTGTAGDGKTSIAMRLALKLTNQGKNIGWLDRNSNIPPYKIKELVHSTDNLEALFIDTPDMYGPEFSKIISQLSMSRKLAVIVLVLRSTKIDKMKIFLDQSISIEEYNTYPLTDNEINKLLDLLEQENLIGALKAMSREKQVDIFKSKADRQLIVAMIEATSGKDFKDKICEELEDLENVTKQIYCLMAVATGRNNYLLKEEVLLGIGEDSDNSTINLINMLVRRGLLTEKERQLRVRHKLIAETVVNRLEDDNHLILYYTRLAYVAAIKSTSPGSEQRRMKRLLKQLLNHEFLYKIGHLEGARNLYISIEDLLKNEHHFWLQRGCLELENGTLSIAENYLRQSSGLNPSDPLVKLSLAHLDFKQAISNPNNERSYALAESAFNDIIGLIDDRGKLDQYPYHVLGVQGFSWAKKGIKSVNKRKKYLENLCTVLEKGAENHPRSKELREIKDEVKEEILKFFIRN